MTRQQQHTVWNLIIFTVVSLGLPFFGRWVDEHTGNASSQASIGMLLWITVPLGISLVLRAFRGDGWKDTGILPHIRGNIGWYALSLLVYPLCIGITLALGFAFGMITFANTSAHAWWLGAQAFGLLALLSLPKNILEESAFRGYVVPKVYSLPLPPLVAYTIAGMIRGCWHFVYFSFVISYLTETPVTLVPRFLLGTIAASLVYGVIRMATGSVWPAILMHTVGGALVGALLTQHFIKMAPGLEFLASPGIEGIFMIVLFTVIGVYLNQRRQQRPATHPLPGAATESV